MPEYSVHYQGFVNMSVSVEADDFDDALELAYEEIPDICGSCAGAWPGQRHRIDINHDGLESYLVTDHDGNEVWKTDTHVEYLDKTIHNLRKEIMRLEDKLKAKKEGE